MIAPFLWGKLAPANSPPPHQGARVCWFQYPGNRGRQSTEGRYCGSAVLRYFGRSYCLGVTGPAAVSWLCLHVPCWYAWTRLVVEEGRWAMFGVSASSVSPSCPCACRFRSTGDRRVKIRPASSDGSTRRCIGKKSIVWVVPDGYTALHTPYTNCPYTMYTHTQ